jgi:hypothetical protein
VGAGARTGAGAGAGVEWGAEGEAVEEIGTGTLAVAPVNDAVRIAGGVPCKARIGFEGLRAARRRLGGDGDVWERERDASSWNARLDPTVAPDCMEAEDDARATPVAPAAPAVAATEVAEEEAGVAPG